MLMLYVIESTPYSLIMPLPRIATALRLTVPLDLYQQMHLISCALTSSPSAISFLLRLHQLGLMDALISVPSLMLLSLREQVRIS